MEANEEKRTIAWGIKKEFGCEQNDVQFYESFMLDGIEYFLYDNVYFYIDCDTGTDMGKLLKIFETPTHEKRVEVLWFFRPMEIRKFLGDYQPKWNELFLASGAGIGLSNQNSLDAIIGKCNVVCASRDWRNQATEQEWRVADYIFCHAFDVGKCTILENFPDEISGVEVKHLLNNRRDHVQKHTQTLSNMPKVKGLIGKSGVSRYVDGCRVNDGMSGGGSRLMVQEAKDVAVSGRKEARIPSAHPILGLGIGVSSVSSIQAVDRPIKASFLDSRPPDFSNRPHKKRQIPTDVKQSNISEESAGKTGLIGKSGVSRNVDGCRVNDGKSGGGSRLMVQEAKDVAVSGRKEARIPSAHPISGLGIGVSSVSSSQAVDRPIKASSLDSQAPDFSNRSHKKQRIPTDVKESNISKESAGKTVEVTKRQAPDKSKWFKQPPWKERLQRADEDGNLVLLRNLDPSFTSSEVKSGGAPGHSYLPSSSNHLAGAPFPDDPGQGTPCWLKGLSTLAAVLIGCEALVIFDSVEAAEISISKLERQCLMLADGRPLIGTRGALKRNGKRMPFFGHLDIERRKHKRPPAEMVKAISTSHCSQPNTIEYEMAIGWCLHQKKSDIWWEKLHEKQRFEIEKLRSQLSLNRKN